MVHPKYHNIIFKIHTQLHASAMLHHPQLVYNYVKQEYTTVYILLTEI